MGVIGQTAFGRPSVIVKLPATASAAEIQRALDQLPPNGEVLLSVGRYEISQPLMLRHDNETLRGSGLTTILHLVDGANCPVVVLAPPMNQTKHTAAHLLLAELQIDGNRRHQKVELWRSAADGSEFMNNGIEIWNANDVSVEHVTCCRCRSGGLVTAKVRRLYVNDYEAFDNQFDGLACYQTEDSDFADLRLHDNLAAGISLDLAFNDNLITNAFLSSNDLGIFMRHSRNNAFKGLTISKCHHHGVFMAQVTEPTQKGWEICPGTQCIGNNFVNLMVNNCGGEAFQVNDASCTNNTILRGEFLHNTLGGMSQPATNPVVLREVAIER